MLQDMQISKSRLENVNFKLISKFLEFLDLSENNLNDSISFITEILS